MTIEQTIDVLKQIAHETAIRDTSKQTALAIAITILRIKNNRVWQFLARYITWLRKL